MFDLHDDVKSVVLEAGLGQFLNVTLHKLHVGFAVTKQLCVVLYITPGHVKLKEKDQTILTLYILNFSEET